MIFESSRDFPGRCSCHVLWAICLDPSRSLGRANAGPKPEPDLGPKLAKISDWLRPAPKSVQILCRKIEEAHTPRRYRIRPTRSRLRPRSAIALQPGPVRNEMLPTLTSMDRYAEGIRNLRGRRSGGMKARTAHNQTTERESIITQGHLLAVSATSPRARLPGPSKERNHEYFRYFCCDRNI